MTTNEVGGSETTIEKTIEDEEVIAESIEELDPIDYYNTVFLDATVADVYQIESSKYSNWDPNEEVVIAVEFRIKGELYVAEYNLSRQFSNHKFKKLLNYCRATKDEPTGMIGERVKILVGGSNLKIFYGDTNSIMSQIMDSKYGNCTNIGGRIKVRYSLPLVLLANLLVGFLAFDIIGGSLGFVLSGAVGVVSIMGLFFTGFGIAIHNSGSELYYKAKNPNITSSE